MRSPLWAVALVLVACPGASTEPPPGSDAPTPFAPVTGGTLRAVAVEDLDALDPHLAARPSSWFVARAVHRGLLTYEPGPSSEPIPDLARPLPSSTPRRLILRLRAGQRFSDGSPIEAGDAVRSLDRLIAAGRGVARWLDVVRGVRAEGRRTVVVTLDRPTTDLRWILAHPQAAIVPRATPDPGVDPLRIVGAGPYRIARYAPERRLVLERGAGESAHTATFDRLEVSIGGSVADAYERIATRDADLLLEPGPLDAMRERIPPDPAPRSCTRFVAVGREPPFDDADVRTAASVAVERAGASLAEVGPAAPSLLPPDILGHRDRTSTRPQVPVRGEPRVELVSGDTAIEQREAEAVRAQLETEGFDASVRTVPSAALVTRYPGRPPPPGILTWCPDWPGDAARNVLGSLQVRRSTAEAIEAAAGTGDAATWDRAERLARADGYLPLVYVPLVPVVSGRLSGPIGSAVLPQGDPFALWLA